MGELAGLAGLASAFAAGCDDADAFAVTTGTLVVIGCLTGAVGALANAACLTGAADGLSGLAEPAGALATAFVAGCGDAFKAVAGALGGVGCFNGVGGDAACLIGAAGALGRTAFLTGAGVTGGVCLFILFLVSFTDVIFTFRFNFSKLAKNHQAKWSVLRGVTHCLYFKQIEFHEAILSLNFVWRWKSFASSARRDYCCGRSNHRMDWSC